MFKIVSMIQDQNKFFKVTNFQIYMTYFLKLLG